MALIEDCRSTCRASCRVVSLRGKRSCSTDTWHLSRQTWPFEKRRRFRKIVWWLMKATEWSVIKITFLISIMRVTVVVNTLVVATVVIQLVKIPVECIMQSDITSIISIELIIFCHLWIALFVRCFYLSCVNCGVTLKAFMCGDNVWRQVAAAVVCRSDVLEPDDQILSINGTSVDGLRQEEVANLLKVQPESVVEIEIEYELPEPGWCAQRTKRITDIHSMVSTHVAFQNFLFIEAHSGEWLDALVSV